VIMQNFKPLSPDMPELAKAGSGIGLREVHYEVILAQKPAVGFLEAHSENFFRTGGIPFQYLMKCREQYPVSLHGVGLSLGSADGVREAHLDKLKTLVDHVAPALISEHISWSGIGGTAVPDLLPLPMTSEALAVVAANIQKVQDRLQRRILVENPSSYLSFKDSEMPEPAFLAEVARRTGCGLLLDINNIHVSAHNLGFDAAEYLRQIPREAVGEIHLAGYQINRVGTHDVFIDAHNHAVYDAVWDLYATALDMLGDVPTLIEWDSDIPALDVLVAEAHKADVIRVRNAKKNSHAA
jgi:uncharacterized protein (UPF0276 family)